MMVDMEDILLEFRDVSYETETLGAVTGLNFSIKRGDNVLFFGPENSGVNFIVNILLGLNQGYTGDVFFGEKSLKSFNYNDLIQYRKNIGYMHGEYGLISNMSAEENISLPLRFHSSLSSADVKKRVSDLIYELNLDHCKKFRPIDLMPSEILRTAYARAIALDPDMLIIDHAVKGHAAINLSSFFENLKKRDEAGNKTIIFVTYEPEKVLDIGDIFIMMYGGRIVFKGSREEFVAGGNPYLDQFKSGASSGPMVIL